MIMHTINLILYIIILAEYLDNYVITNGPGFYI